MNGMTEGVEQHIEKRMADFELKVQATDDHLEQLSPKLDRIRAGLHDIDSAVTVDLASSLQASDNINQVSEKSTDVYGSDRQTQSMQAWIARRTCSEP